MRFTNVCSQKTRPGLPHGWQSHGDRTPRLWAGHQFDILHVCRGAPPTASAVVPVKKPGRRRLRAVRIAGFPCRVASSAITPNAMKTSHRACAAFPRSWPERWRNSGLEQAEDPRIPVGTFENLPKQQNAHSRRGPRGSSPSEPGGRDQHKTRSWPITAGREHCDRPVSGRRDQPEQCLLDAGRQSCS